MEWSYRLLSSDHQSLLAWLSVCSGTFDLEAVAALSDAMEGAGDCLEIVSDLVDASLVRTAPGSGEPRFVLLNTVRMFGLQKLRDRGTQAACQRAHAQHYLRRANHMNERALAGEPIRTEVLLDAANYRAILDALPLELTDPEDQHTPVGPIQVLALIAELLLSARIFVENKDRLLAGLDDSESEDDAIGRAACLSLLGEVHVALDEVDAAVICAERALVALRDADLRPTRPKSHFQRWTSPFYIVNFAHAVKGYALMRMGDFEGGRRAAQRVLDSGTESRELQVHALETLMWIASRGARFDEAEQILLEATRDA